MKEEIKILWVSVVVIFMGLMVLLHLDIAFVDYVKYPEIRDNFSFLEYWELVNTCGILDQCYFVKVYFNVNITAVNEE